MHRVGVGRRQMDWLPERAGFDPSLVKALQELAGALAVSGFIHQHRGKPAVSNGPGSFRDHPQTGYFIQGVAITSSKSLAGSDKLIELFHLCAAQSGLKI